MKPERKHAAHIPIADDIIIRDPDIFEDPDFTNGDLALHSEEIDFFKKHGFLVKRGFLDQPDTFTRIVDYVWESVPREVFEKDKPETWIGAPSEQWTENDNEAVGVIQGNSWKMRSRDGIGTEPFFLDDIANHPRMRELVSYFIGEPLKLCERVRGVYCQFPTPQGQEGILYPHTDYTACQLSVMVFVDDVPASCGGFTLWPGSHLTLHRYWETIQSGTISDAQADAYAGARDRVLHETTPIEFPGKAGDVLFWHPRLLHSAGINDSGGSDNQILRLIVPCDYQIDGNEFFDDLVHGPGPNHQWWVDTRHFHDDIPTTPDNIWKSWEFRVS